MRLSWTLLNSLTPAPPSSNWRGEYYNNPVRPGACLFGMTTVLTLMVWRFTATRVGQCGQFLRTPDVFTRLGRRHYWFSITVDDGARLWVNNQLIIDAWRDEAVTSYAGTISLPGGPVPVRLEYYERSNVASIHLAWALTDNTSNNSGGSGGTIRPRIISPTQSMIGGASISTIAN